MEVFGRGDCQRADPAAGIAGVEWAVGKISEVSTREAVLAAFLPGSFTIIGTRVERCMVLCLPQMLCSPGWKPWVVPGDDDGVLRQPAPFQFGGDVAGELVHVAGGGGIAVAHHAVEFV